MVRNPPIRITEPPPPGRDLLEHTQTMQTFFGRRSSQAQTANSALTPIELSSPAVFAAGVLKQTLLLGLSWL